MRLIELREHESHLVEINIDKICYLKCYEDQDYTTIHLECGNNVAVDMPISDLRQLIDSKTVDISRDKVKTLVDSWSGEIEYDI